MIELKQLSHSFGKKVVLENIDLSIPDHTILGLVGINGAGKSTLLRLLAGVYSPHQGSVLFDGLSPSDPSVRQQIFFLPDDPYYTSSMTPKRLFCFYLSFYPQMDRSAFESLLAIYQINPKEKMRNFSKGMRRQVFIALALAAKPRYLLMDEAFDGLDPLSRKIFKDAIISFAESETTTVMISSHSLRELEDFCDRFALLDQSHIQTQGDIAEHVGSFCKFELAFFEPVPPEYFAHLPTYSLSIKGRFVQIVLEGSSEQWLPALQQLSPAVMDEMPLDFEEMFIHDVANQKRAPENTQKRGEHA